MAVSYRAALVLFIRQATIPLPLFYLIVVLIVGISNGNLHSPTSMLDDDDGLGKFLPSFPRIAGD